MFVSSAVFASWYLLKSQPTEPLLSWRFNPGLLVFFTEPRDFSSYVFATNTSDTTTFTSLN